MIKENRLRLSPGGTLLEALDVTTCVTALQHTLYLIQKSFNFVIHYMEFGNQNSRFNKQKALNAILFIASYLKDCGKHGLLKTLYSAEKRHVARYGRTICSGRIIKMERGPVSSEVYDMLKSTGNENTGYFAVEGKNVFPVGEVNLDVFSDSEIDCLEEAIEENNDLNFQQRTDNSHDGAWDAAVLNKEMDLYKIAQAGGADADMLQYIKQVLEYR